MSVQLLDKTRKINKLLHNNHSHRVEFNDICEVLSGILVVQKSQTKHMKSFLRSMRQTMNLLMRKNSINSASLYTRA